METSEITAILDPAAHTGIGKNGKPWTQAMVELQNGAQVRMFMPVRVGDKVESYDNNGYKNWRVIKQDKADQAEMLKIIQLIYDITESNHKDLQLIKKNIGITEPDQNISLNDI